MPPCLRLSQGDIAICCLLLGRTRQPASATRAWPSSIPTCRGLSLRGPSSTECHRRWGSSQATTSTRSRLSQVPHRHQTLWAAQSSQLRPSSCVSVPPSTSRSTLLKGCVHGWYTCLRLTNMQPHSSMGPAEEYPKLGPCPLPTAWLCKHQPHCSELPRSKTMAPSAALGPAGDSPAEREHTPPAPSASGSSSGNTKMLFFNSHTKRHSLILNFKAPTYCLYSLR